MGDVNLDNIKATLGLSEGLNVGVSPISADVGLANIGARVSGGVELKTELAGGVQGKFDVGLNDIRLNTPVRVEAAIKELPVVRTDSAVKLEFAFRPMRVRAPVNCEFSLKVLGIPIFRFSISGEASAVVENL